MLVTIWTLLLAGAAGSTMSLGLPGGDALAAIDPVADGAAATDQPSRTPALSVDLRREATTLVVEATVRRGHPGNRVRLDGAFGIYDVTETTGLVADGSGYRLASGRERGSLTARLDLSTPRETALGPVGPDGAFQSGDDWAFAPSPRFTVRWTAPGEDVSRLRFDGATVADDSAVSLAAPADVAVGERFLFLGDHAVHTRDVDGRRVRFVVPAGVDFAVGVDRSASLLGRVQSETGTRASGTVTAFVLPHQVRSGGAASGSDLWLRGDVGDVTVAHEFAHATLTLRTTTETKWLREASAEYLAFRAVEGDDAAATLDARVRHRDASLTDPSSWSDSSVPYREGAARLAALDARLRASTDGAVTAGTLLGTLSNESPDGDALTHEALVDAVRRVGGGETAARFDESTTGGRASASASNQSVLAPPRLSLAGA